VEFLVANHGQPQQKGRIYLKDKYHSEVILSTGAVLTPQLLANSGIGPEGSALHVPGVGQNLQDHPVVAMAYEISEELAVQASSIYTIGDEMEDYFLAVSGLQGGTVNDTGPLYQELMNRLGPLGTPGFASGAFLRSPWASPDDDSPDLQLTVFPREIEPHVLRLRNRSDESYLRSRSMLVTIALLQPDARYRVVPAQHQNILDNAIPSPKRDFFRTKLVSNSLLAQSLGYRLPLIELPLGQTDYLSDRDVKTLAWGMEQVRQLLHTPPLDTATNHEIYPGPAITGPAMEDYVRQHHMPNSHWVGSTRMGHDILAVVNERLQVHGMQGLRIVDGGVLPRVPNGNTHSTICVVASRAADFMIEDRKAKT
jgi:choline dehydrogenase